MLSFAGQSALEDWLRACPLDGSGPSYSTQLERSMLSVRIGGSWDLPARSPLATETGTAFAAASSERPRADACAASGNPSVVVSGMTREMETLRVQLATPLPPPHQPSHSEPTQPKHVTDGGGDPCKADGRGDACSAKAQCADGRNCADSAMSAAAVRALLGQNLGLSFPKPPGRSFN